MQLVKSCRIDDGAEIDKRYSLYLTASEFSVLQDVFGLLFGPPDFPRDGLDVKEFKSRFTDVKQLLGVRMFWSLFREA